jgi:hypothetical protein
VERALSAKVKLSLTYSHSHIDRTQRVVNINAPLGGTFIPGVPGSGVRPLGAEAGNVLEYQANGRSMRKQSERKRQRNVEEDSVLEWLQPW